MADHLGGGQATSNAGGVSAGADQNQQTDQNADFGQFQSLTQEQIYALHENQQNLSKENEELKGTLEKLRGVFSPEQPKSNAPDMQWYDDILQMGLEAEKQGRGMPVTIDLATRTKQMVEQNAELRQQLAELQRQVKHVSNPDTLNNNRVYENIDNTIHNSIEAMYGKVEPQFARYISSVVADDVKTLQSKHPEAWARVRGSHQLQERLVQKALQDALPENVRNKLRDDYLRESPMTKDDLAQAYAEAEQFKDKDPQLYSKLRREARQRYWETAFSENKQNSFASRVQRYSR
jgi:hypothetical protein